VSDDVGKRMRQLRKLRGLTQAQLARQTHFSTSLIKKVEQGSVPPSAGLVAEAARCLQVKPSHLYGTDARELADQPRVEAAGIAALRLALDSYDDPQPDGDLLTVAQARRRIDRIGADIYRLAYESATQALVPLLHHLFVLVGEPGDDARAILHDGYRLAASVAGQYRQADLAAICTERHVALAPLTGDPLRVAISAYHRSTRHLQSGEFSHGLRILDRAHDALGTDATARAIGIQLHLRSAVLAARAGDRTQADEHIIEARAISEAADVPATPYYNIDASRLNIDIHWCAVPMEDYDGTTAVERSRHVRIVDPLRPERVGHHHVDMARAWLLHGDRTRALDQLNRARQVAPARIRHHPSVRTTVLSIADNDRHVTDSLASFARWASITI
jgi:transcriptional regulator with XRE-family HTH domain